VDADKQVGKARFKRLASQEHVAERKTSLSPATVPAMAGMKSVAKKIARPKITFYAKRTQFPKNQNERNSLSNKQLHRKTRTPLHHPNEPKQTQFQPNFQRAKTNLTFYMARDYEKNHDFKQLKTKQNSEMNITFY